MRKIMACLDVGSDTVKCVVGEMVKRKLNILAVADAPSKGVKYGIVEDPSSLLDPLKNVIQKCEEIIGLRLKQVVVSVPAILTFTIISILFFALIIGVPTLAKLKNRATLY